MIAVGAVPPVNTNHLTAVTAFLFKLFLAIGAVIMAIFYPVSAIVASVLLIFIVNLYIFISF